MIRYLSLVVLGLVVAATPIWAAPALASRHAESAPTPAPLSYRAELRRSTFGVPPAGDVSVPIGEQRTTIWYRSPNLYRSETALWSAVGFGKNLGSTPTLLSTFVRGPDTAWLASSSPNRPDADVLGQPLSPQLVTIEPTSLIPVADGIISVGGRAPLSSDRTAVSLGALGQCYEAPRLVEHGTVAGQPVNVFEFRHRADCVSSPLPEIAGTAVRLISIDSRTGLVLKDEALDNNGARIAGATSEIRTIDYDANVPDSLFTFEPAQGAHTHRCADLQCTATSFPQAQSTTGLPDYTVVTLSGSITADGQRYLAEVTVGGAKREVSLTRDCYERVRRARLDALPNTLSTVVPPDCRR